jgi:hypothetical protein
LPQNNSYVPWTLALSMEIEKEKCQICGKPAKYFQFAAFICESEECANKAMEERGGPAGQIKAKREEEERKRKEGEN